MTEKKLYMWRAWSADNKRICDCGVAWAVDEDEALLIANIALGGPYMHEVAQIKVEKIQWPSAPHGRQVTTCR